MTGLLAQQRQWQRAYVASIRRASKADGEYATRDASVLFVLLHHMSVHARPDPAVPNPAWPYCWVTNGSIAELTGLSERSVSRAVGALEARGVIRRIRRNSSWLTCLVLPALAAEGLDSSGESPAMAVYPDPTRVAGDQTVVSTQTRHVCLPRLDSSVYQREREEIREETEEGQEKRAIASSGQRTEGEGRKSLRSTSSTVPIGDRVRAFYRERWPEGEYPADHVSIAVRELGVSRIIVEGSVSLL